MIGKLLIKLQRHGLASWLRCRRPSARINGILDEPIVLIQKVVTAFHCSDAEKRLH